MPCCSHKPKQACRRGQMSRSKPRAYLAEDAAAASRLSRWAPRPRGLRVVEVDLAHACEGTTGASCHDHVGLFPACGGTSPQAHHRRLRKPNPNPNPNTNTNTQVSDIPLSRPWGNEHVICLPGRVGRGHQWHQLTPHHRVEVPSVGAPAAGPSGWLIPVLLLEGMRGLDCLGGGEKGVKWWVFSASRISARGEGECRLWVCQLSPAVSAAYLDRTLSLTIRTFL